MGKGDRGGGVGMVLTLLAMMASSAVWAAPEAAQQPVSHGRFQQVGVRLPDHAPERVVIWFQERGEPLQSHGTLAALRRDGAVVATVDVGAVRAALAREGAGTCAFGIGDVENFSRWLQAYLHLPGYRLPILGGDGQGASLAYALAAQADRQVIAGLLTHDFRPAWDAPAAFCGPAINQGHLRAVPLPRPWLAASTAAAVPPDAQAVAAARFVQSVALARAVRANARGDVAPALVAAARVLGTAAGVSSAPPPADLQGLPVVEVPSPQPGDTLAVFLSGDGGWAGLDKDVAAALAAQGVAVVGVDSLRYFWTPRTPSTVAADLQRIVQHYRQQWQRPRVLLIGFSQGADVLPASINQMAPAARAELARIVLLSVGRKADFEFHVSNWLGSSDSGLPIAPELLRLPAATTWCVYGKDDADAVCPDLPANAVHVLALPGDHHFNGDHDRLAQVIVQGLQSTPR